MSEGCDWSLATNGLGEDYNITRMTFKNHGCCGHAFAAIDGALALSNQHQFDPADILNIRVDGYSATVDICGSNTHATPYEGRFSVPYLVATALTHGSARLDAFTEARLTDPAPTALTAKVDSAWPPRGPVVHQNAGRQRSRALSEDAAWRSGYAADRR